MRRGITGSGPALAAVVVWVLAGGLFTAAALDEGLSSRRVLGGGQVPVPAIFDQTRPALAFDSQSARITLAAWEDHRSGGADIFAARFDSAGAVLDPIGVPVAVSPAEETSPAVAFNGDSFMVVWTAVIGESRYQILGARYGTDGSRLDEQPVQIASSIYELASSAIVWQGTDWLVFWTDSRSGSAEVYSTLISAAGTVADPDGELVTGGRGDLRALDVTLGSGGCLLSWADEYLQISEADTSLTGDIVAVMTDLAGETTMEPFTVAHTSSYESSPDAAYNGEEFLVVWNHRRDAGTQFVFGRTVSPQGTVQADSISIGRTIDGVERGFREYPNIVHDGEQFVVSWVGITSEGVFGATVDLQVSPPIVSPVIEFVHARANTQAAAWNGSRHVFVYSHHNSGLDVSVAFADRDETPADGGGLVSSASPAQLPTALVFSGDSYLAVWEEQCAGGQWCARASRISTDGSVLDPGGVELFDEPSAIRRYPAVAAGNDTCLLVWAQEGTFGRDIMGRLIDTEGAPQSSDLLLSSFLGSQSEAAPACAWNGDHFLISWRMLGAVLAARVSVVAGEPVLLDGFPFTFQEGNEFTDPGLVAFDGGYFGAWGEPDTLNGMQQDTTVERSILVKTPGPGAPALAPIGSLCQVVWTDENGFVQTIRMRDDSRPFEPGAYQLSSFSSPRERPAVMNDGNTALAFWRENHGETWALVGARLGSDGSIQTPGVFVAADEDPVQGWPIAAAGPAGSGFVVYSGLSLTEDLASLRISGKLWHADPPELSIAIHQNPVLTSDIAVYAFSSEALQLESVTMHANGAPLEVGRVAEEHGVFRGLYEARATAAVNVVVEGLDEAGNLGRASRSFAVGLLDTASPFLLASPCGAIRLALPADAVEQPAVVLLSPENEWMYSADGESWQFMITPLALNRPACISIDLRESNQPQPTAESGRTWVLERNTPDGWVALAASGDSQFSTTVDQLGGFRVRLTSGQPVVQSRLQLDQGPEPFRAALSIRYFLPSAGRVTLSVFDASGRRIRNLVSGPVEGGWHSAAWDGRDIGGRRAESGVYFTRLEFGAETIARRCVFMR